MGEREAIKGKEGCGNEGHSRFAEHQHNTPLSLKLWGLGKAKDAEAKALLT